MRNVTPIILFLLCLTAAGKSSAQTFTSLFSFGGTNGQTPTSLVQSKGGLFWGVTGSGGANAGGTIFTATPAGAVTTVYNFCAKGGTSCTDGKQPLAPLAQASNGDFYGTTYAGGTHGFGTVFRITASGAFTTLHSFCSEPSCADGERPGTPLVQFSNGDLYGTTSNGGSYGTDGYGTMFKVTPNGSLTTLVSFPYGDGVPVGPLVRGADGNFYGTAAVGRCCESPGYVFRLTPAGTLTNIYNFCSQKECTDGESPGPLVVGPDGNFYGTTEAGQRSSSATIFRITMAGVLTTIYTFPGETYPSALLVVASNESFYGVTGKGGSCSAFSFGCGTIFKVTPDGSFTSFYDFCAAATCADGVFPNGLIQATTGEFYGTTNGGGTGPCVNGTFPSGCGTIFSFSAALPSFVETQPASGPAGAIVEILGTNLAGTTSVTQERTLPVLDAAHIKPYAVGGQHEVRNGLLLRSDLHTLFDQGYLTVDPENYRLVVSGRIREEFENGRHYYELHGKPIKLPVDSSAVPSVEHLEYHSQAIFR